MIELDKIYAEGCEATMPRFADSSVPLIITSPPYADRRKSTYGGIPEDKYIEWFLPKAEEMKRILTPDGSLFINLKEHTVSNKGRSLYVMKLVIAMVEELGYHWIDTFAWTRLAFPGKIRNKFKNAWEPVYHFSKNYNIAIYPDQVSYQIMEETLKRAGRQNTGKSKNNSGFSQASQDNILKLDKALPSNHIHVDNILNQYSENKWHPAVFPQMLTNFFVQGFSKPGDTVYDPFVGSGTTLKSAWRFGRHYLGSEIMPEIAAQAQADLLKYQQNPKLL